MLWYKVKQHLPKPIREALYWLRTHTYNRYHMLDCRSEQNGYKWGWQDLCQQILFANMNILKLYVEKEADRIDWQSDPGHATARGEMEVIYQWWMKGRKLAHDDYDALMTKAYGFGDCTVLEDRFVRTEAHTAAVVALCYLFLLVWHDVYDLVFCG